MMCRVPSGRRFASWLALFALALQLALSFGHVHVSGIATPAVKVAGTHAPSSSPGSPPAHPADDADDYCAICATIYLASTTFLPPAVRLPVFFVWRPVEHVVTTTTIFAAPRRTFFQSRAPPFA